MKSKLIISDEKKIELYNKHCTFIRGAGDKEILKLIYIMILKKNKQIN